MFSRNSLAFSFFLFYFIFKLYITVLVLPNIKMNTPQVYMCSPSWTLLPPPSPFHPSGSSQCTSPKHPVSCFKPGLATRFIHDDDPSDVGNLISASSAFSKSSLNIWKFIVHVLLKPGLENFEHYFASVWDECNCVVVATFLALPFFGIGIKTDLFLFCGHC